MTFEHTQDIQNLYLTSECYSYGKLVPCTVPTNVLRSTKLWIATNSSALADGALSVSEVEDAGLNLYLYSYWDANKTAQWAPGDVQLQFSGPASGLVAYASGTSWRLYESARVKRVKVKFHCLDVQEQDCETADIFQLYAGIIQVEMTRFADPILRTKSQMFLTGKLVAN